MLNKTVALVTGANQGVDGLRDPQKNDHRFVTSGPRRVGGLHRLVLVNGARGAAGDTSVPRSLACSSPPSE
jgi:hypothetical protein